MAFFRPFAPLLLLICVLFRNAFATELRDPKETYGVDDRRDIFEVTDPQILSLARSVCAIMEAESLRDNGDGTHTILSEPNVLESEQGSEVAMCPDEPFANQPFAAVCTGFLVRDDVIVTAGHCIVDFNPDSFRIVFGWEMLDSTTPARVIPSDNVYEIAEVIDARLNWFKDHAILRLDRPVTVPGAVPLEVRQRGHVRKGTPIGIIGHPMGLPLKAAFGDDTQVYRNFRPLVFISNFDASGGNSGSPVFNQETGVVEGIYVYSDVPDFILDGSCFRVNSVPDREASQGVMRSTNFSHLIPGNRRQKLLPVCGANTDASAASSWLADGLLMFLLFIFLARHRARSGGKSH